MRLFVGLPVLVIASGLLHARAEANDRLPVALRTPYASALKEVRAYTDFVMERVFGAAWRLGQGPRGEAIAESVDEAVHLALPFARRVVEDMVFGTGNTFVRLTHPERRAVALKAAMAAQRSGGSQIGASLGVLGVVGRGALDARLEQALVEDLEAHVSSHAERLAGGAVTSRARASTRPLPAAEERRYREHIRRQVHRQAYWWLRKKQRLALAHLATTHSQAELDRVRHEGGVWGLSSALSHAAWEQSRLEMDFRWGRPNWQILRRRVRRRLDQDLARGVWSMAKVVRELERPEVRAEAERQLTESLKKRLQTGPLREQAERYPETAGALKQAMEPALDALGPLWDRAMSRVRLPNDIDALAKQHGHRWAREELRGALGRVLRDEAAGHAAARAVRERLPSLVHAALAGFDPGPGVDAETLGRRVRRHVSAQTRSETARIVRESLRASGVDEPLHDDSGAARVERVHQEHDLDGLVRRATDAALAEPVRTR